MPADTPAKRYSAMSINCPWRGLNVVPAAITQGQRQAVMYMYSGILAGGAVAATAILNVGFLSNTATFMNRKY